MSAASTRDFASMSAAFARALATRTRASRSALELISFAARCPSALTFGRDRGTFGFHSFDGRSQRFRRQSEPLDADLADRDTVDLERLLVEPITQLAFELVEMNFPGSVLTKFARSKPLAAISIVDPMKLRSWVAASSG